MKIAGYLQRWKEAGLLDQATVTRITNYEKSRGGLKFAHALYGIGVLAIMLGVAAIIGVNWDAIPAALKLTSHLIVNGIIAAVIFYLLQQGRKGIAVEMLLAVLAGLTLTFIALAGQIYQSQEPTWKALTLWLVLVTPFLFVLAQSRFLIAVWIVSFFAAYFMFVTNEMDNLSPLASALFCSLLPFVMIIGGQTAFLRRLRERWATIISFTGFLLIVVQASLAQIVWRDSTTTIYPLSGKISETVIWEAGLITFVVSLGIVTARRAKLLVPMAEAVDLFLPLSVIVSFLPFLMPHVDCPVIGAAIVMAYWAFCGWAGTAAGYPRTLDIAIALIAARLFGVYIEVFGSLLQTGVGLIISGILLIGLVIATRRVRIMIRPAGGRKQV